MLIDYNEPIYMPYEKRPKTLYNNDFIIPKDAIFRKFYFGL